MQSVWVAFTFTKLIFLHNIFALTPVWLLGALYNTRKKQVCSVRVVIGHMAECASPTGFSYSTETYEKKQCRPYSDWRAVSGKCGIAFNALPKHERQCIYQPRIIYREATVYVFPPWDKYKHIPPTTFPLYLYLSRVLSWAVALH